MRNVSSDCAEYDRRFEYSELAHLLDTDSPDDEEDELDPEEDILDSEDEEFEDELEGPDNSDDEVEDEDHT